MSRLSADAEPSGGGREKLVRRHRPGRLKMLGSRVVIVIVAVALAMLLRTYVMQFAVVRGISMEPTLYEGEWLLVNKIVYAYDEPRRGDIVILRNPSERPDSPKLIVKRIIGEPGDTLEIRGGRLYVDGARLIEPYVDAEIADGGMAPVRVSDGHYFVMGDNRRLAASEDSRSFREVERERIVGRAEFVIWPIPSWKRL
jgi:signal peptidase I